MYDTEFGRLRIEDKFYLKEDYLLKNDPAICIKTSENEAYKILLMPIPISVNKDTKVIPIYGD